MSIICLKTFRDKHIVKKLNESDIHDQFEDVLLNNDMRNNEANTFHAASVSRAKQSREKSAGLSYYPKLKVWKASNVAYCPETETATSYDWWVFVKRINGKLIFNNYSYSNTTNRHQHKVNIFLSQKEIKIDHFIHAPQVLKNLSRAISHYKYMINKLQKEIDNPKSREIKNQKRRLIIKEFEKSLKIIKLLIHESKSA